MAVSQLEEALAGHPRIGETPASHASSAKSAEWSQQDQARVHVGNQETINALALVNREYELRFNHIYLVCAPGKSGKQLLRTAQARMRNNAGAEWEVVRRELQKINAVRLKRLLAGPA
jgi:2-oxo-4-hydroxy-4-carboxy-5-ureidoimidazoline decarboxylase